MQSKLRQYEPNGLSTGFVKISVPKLKEGNENHSLLMRKKLHLLNRIAIMCGISMEKILSTKSVHIAKSHWRRSALEYVDKCNKTMQCSVSSFYQFDSRSEWEGVTGVLDEEDIFQAHL